MKQLLITTLKFMFEAFGRTFFCFQDPNGCSTFYCKNQSSELKEFSTRLSGLTGIRSRLRYDQLFSRSFHSSIVTLTISTRISSVFPYFPFNSKLIVLLMIYRLNAVRLSFLYAKNVKL